MNLLTLNWIYWADIELIKFLDTIAEEIRKLSVSLRFIKTLGKYFVVRRLKAVLFDKENTLKKKVLGSNRIKNIVQTLKKFQYNGKHYQQLHGTAMGSPVSVVVAEVVMQSIEEQALATYELTLPFWFRYVHDTITALHDYEIDQFYNHLNSQNRNIQFTKEIEEKGTLPFLDCLVKRDNDELRTTVYRKPTHTDRLLDESSYNPTSHKATTIKTLTRHAQLICDSPDALPNENEYLQHVFRKNNYNSDFIKLNTYKDHEINETSHPTTTTATIP